MKEITIIIEKDLHFLKSSKESLIKFISNIGSYSQGEDSYLIKRGQYDISIDLDKLMKMTLVHDIEVQIYNGKVILG